MRILPMLATTTATLLLLAGWSSQAARAAETRYLFRCSVVEMINGAVFADDRLNARRLNSVYAEDPSERLQASVVGAMFFRPVLGARIEPLERTEAERRYVIIGRNSTLAIEVTVSNLPVPGRDDRVQGILRARDLSNVTTDVATLVCER